MSDDLIAFLRARLDEDEQVARAVVNVARSGPEWRITAIPDRSGPTVILELGGTGDRVVLTGVYDDDPLRWDEAAHIARWDPARVLAEVEAKRALLDYISTMRRGGHASSVNGRPGTWTPVGRDHREPLLRLLAVPYAGHPDFRPAWRPAAE